MLPRLDLCESAALSYIDPNFFSSNACARILVRNGVTQIAVAGSNDCKDWIEDLDAILVERQGRGRIFKGFAEMADQSKMAFLQRIMSYPGPYEFVGHSAGCVLALQWAAWLAELGREVKEVQLFASPTVGDSGWVEYYQKFNIPTLRIAMLHDPVPSLPGIKHGGAYECETLVLDQEGVSYEAQDIDSELNLVGLIAQVEENHPLSNYLRGLRCYLKAG